jgi:hypothetical protein
MSHSHIKERYGLALVVETILVQLLTFATGIGLITIEISPLFLIFSTTLLALILSIILKHSRLWIILNGVTPSLVFFYISHSLPLLPISLVIIFLFIFFLPSFKDRVPYYPSNPRVYHELIKIVEEQTKQDGKKLNFIDIGSGSATLLLALASRFREHNFYGVELSPLPYLISKFRLLASRLTNLEIRMQSFWKINLSDYEIIYAFLSPEPMPKLHQKFINEARLNTIFISNSFQFQAKENRLILLNQAGRSKALYIYIKYDYSSF